jgi:hypothetical protein
MSEELRAVKAQQITESLTAGNLEHLRHLCRTPFGLVSALLRKEVWPLLLGVTPDFYPDWSSKANSGTKATSVSAKVINQDVSRTFVSLDLTDNDCILSKAIKRKELYTIINAVVSLDESLSYYQGFNEITSIFFLVGGINVGFKLSMKVAQNYLRDCMRASFDDGFLGAMKFIYTLLRFKSPDLHEVMSSVMPEVSLT